MEPESSLLCSQEVSISSYSEQYSDIFYTNKLCGFKLDWTYSRSCPLVGFDFSGHE
jgi:hypothetical protein